MSGGKISNEVSKLKEIIALCKASGVQRVKVGDVEIDFGEQMKSNPGPDPKTMAALAKALGAGDLTPEEVLFHSVEQFVGPKDVKES